jgi:membrane-associated phospholipid phosphatase
MRDLLARIETELLPRGRRDLVRQFGLFLGVYVLYELVRGLVAQAGSRPFSDATRIIDLERRLHVFLEPAIQAWVNDHAHPLLDLADWAYLNAHFVLTIGALIYIYARRNVHFYVVRDMFLIAMAIALVGYAAYPTAPPRLLPGWGFTDSIRQFTGISIERGPGSALLNAYAAVPSMHVCFALMIGVPMSRITTHPAAKLLWLLYPALITFVVVATGNHFFTDVLLGALTAAVAATAARRRHQQRARIEPRVPAPVAAAA